MHWKQNGDFPFWEHEYFLEAEEGLLVAWGRKILVFQKENVHF